MARIAMRTLLHDIRYAFRSFGSSPGFTAAALLSLAISIGANTSVFSVANALLLRPLPYQDADRLVILWNRSPGLGISQDWFSTAQYFDIRASQQSFEQTAIAIGGTYNLTGDGEPERVGAVRVSSSLFPMLGVRPQLGRLFVAEEDEPGHTPTAILSYEIWTRRYGSSAAIVGKSILINGQAYQVAGVLPRSFALPRDVLPTLYGTDRADIFLPLPLGPAAAKVRTHEDYNIVAKLKRGVRVEQARAEMETLTARLRRDYPEVYPPNGGLNFGVVPLLEQVVGDVRRMLILLLGSVGFVLLIACANVANLLLSRALARQKEIAVRAAMGATFRRIISQLLTESVLLAVCGGGLGVLLALWSLEWIRASGTKSIPRLEAINLDERVLLFALLISLVSGVLFGLAPAFRASRMDLHTTLQLAGRGSAGAGALWGKGVNLRKVLVAVELALSVVLLIGAGLLIRSFTQLQSVAPGFDPRSVLTFELSLSGPKYTDLSAVLNAYQRLWEHLEQLPGASAAGGTTSLPMNEAYAWTPITIEGRTPPAGEKFINADARAVGGHYFEAMRIPLRSGRFFNEHDTLKNPRVVIIDERTAKEYWPGESPLGKRIQVVQLKPENSWQVIVGVVGRVKQDSLDSDPRIAFYMPHTQSPSRTVTVALRSNSDPARLTTAVKNEVRRIDRDVPIYSVRTMQSRVDESLARRRFFQWMLSLFAVLALALATIGIYGVMAFVVNQGTREIGIRIAVGATEQAILGMVLRQGMMLAASGVAAGLVAAMMLTRLMRSLLFGIGPADALTFGSIALMLGVITLAASYIPARRAARVDPISSLRSE